MFNLMRSAKGGGLLDQLPALLKAMGVKIASREVEGAERRDAVLSFVKCASLPSGQLIELSGVMKGGGKMTALVIVSD